MGLEAGPLSLHRWMVRLHHGGRRRKTSQVNSPRADIQSTCLWEELGMWKEKTRCHGGRRNILARWAPHGLPEGNFGSLCGQHKDRPQKGHREHHPTPPPSSPSKANTQQHDGEAMVLDLLLNTESESVCLSGLERLYF